MTPAQNSRLRGLAALYGNRPGHLLPSQEARDAAWLLELVGELRTSLTAAEARSAGQQATAERCRALLAAPEGAALDVAVRAVLERALGAEEREQRWAERWARAWERIRALFTADD
jgi:hypothetical protein